MKPPGQRPETPCSDDALPPPGLALAQTDYPNKPIRLVMGFPPGGSGDFAGRTLGEEMGRLLGQPVVGDNRPGAATNIASEFVAKAPADEHTLLMDGSFSHSVNPALFACMPVDVARDFTPIGKVVSSPTVFAVPATLPGFPLRYFTRPALHVSSATRSEWLLWLCCSMRAAQTRKP